MRKKDLIQLYITGALVLVLVLLIAKTFSRKKRVVPPPRTTGVAAGAQGSFVKEERAGGLYTRLEEETKGLVFDRDPFFRQRAVAVLGPSLEGIVWDEGNPTAVINETIVGVGTEISGYTVIQILKARVILMNNTDGEELVLELFR